MKFGRFNGLIICEPTGDGSEGEAGGTGSGEGGAAAEEQTPRTFTEEQVNAIVQDRLARAKSKPPADYEDLKQKAARLAEIEAENQTELQKAEKRATEAEKLAAEALATSKRVAVDSSIVTEAVRLRVDPDIAVALLDREILEFDDSGRPTNTAVAVEALLKLKPQLAANGGSRGNADQGARGGATSQLTRAALQSMTPQEIVEARKAGKLASLMSTGS